MYLYLQKELSQKTDDLLVVDVVDDFGYGVKVNLWREAKDRIKDIGI